MAVTGCLAVVTAGLTLLPVPAEATTAPPPVTQIGPNDVRISQQTVPGGIENTAVAYDPGHDRYLVVWQGLSMDDGAGNAKAVVYGQFVDARTGSEVGTNDFTVAQFGAADDPNTDALNPAVVWNPSHHEFVVAFEGATDTDPSALVTDTNEVFVQRVSDSGALVGGQLKLSDMAGTPVSTSYDATQPPDIAYDATDDQYLVVWRGDANGITLNNENEVFSRRLGYSAGSLTALGGGMVQLSDVGGANLTNGQFDASEPAVAWNSTADEYLVTWQADDNADGGVDNAFRIWGQRVTAGGDQVGANDLLISTVGAPTDTDTETFSPEVAYNPDRGEYLVVWEGDGANGTAGAVNDFEIWGQRLAGSDASAVGGNTQLSQMGPPGSSSYTAQHAAVAYDTDNVGYLVTWTGDDNTGGLVNDEQETFATRLSGTLGTVAAQTPISDMGPTGVPHVAPTASAVAYSEGSVDDYLVVWGGENPGVTAPGESEVWGQLVAPAADLQLTSTASPAAPAVGDQVTYTLSYRNSGPDAALGTAVTDLVPSSLTDLAWSSTGPTPTVRTGASYVCDLPTLAGGQSGTITVTGTVAAGTAEGTVVSNTASIGSSTAVADQSGNDSDTKSVTVDNPPRVLSITRSGSTPTNATTVSFLVTFDQPVSGVSAGAFGVSTTGLSGATVTNVSGTGATRTVTVAAGSGEGTLRLDLVDGSGIVDTGIAGGKALVGPLPFTGPSYTVDRTAPGVSLSSAAPDPTHASPLHVTATFSEPVTGLTLADLTVTNGSASNLSGSGASYTVDVTPSGQGVVTVDVPAGSAADAAGNLNTASATLSRVFDSVRPALTLGSTSPDPTNGSPIQVTASFSEPVTGFGLTDVTVGNGTADNLSGTGDGYSFDVTPSGQGPVTVDVPAGAAQDAAGNDSTAAATLQRQYDSVRPGVTASTSVTDPTSTSPVPVTVTFTEPVTGLALSDLDVVNGTPSGLAGSGTTWTVDVTPAGQGLVSVTVVDAAASDLAGNPSTASDTLAWHYDSTRPTVVITTTAPDPTNTSPIPVSLAFSEDVTGLTAGDLSVAGATVANLDGSGSTYTADLVPTAQGAVTASVPAGAAVDGAGNTSTASGELTVHYDSVRPTASLSSSASDPTRLSPIPFAVTFSEDVTGLTAGDVTVTNGTVDNLQGSAGSYTFDVTPSTQGPVTVQVPRDAAHDAAGNGSEASDTVTRVFDDAAPTLTLGSTAGDPTSTAPIPVTAQFDEAVTGFAADDLTVSGATVGGFTRVDADTYTFDLVDPAEGLVTVDVAAGAAVDAAGNESTSAVQLTRTFDSVRPSATLTSTAAEPSNSSSLPVHIELSEPVTGLSAGDLVVDNGTVDSLTGSGSSYDATVLPAPGLDGVVTVTLPADSATDAAGNGNTADSLTRTVDLVAPTVTVDQAAGQADPTTVSPVRFTVVFSEPVTGFAAGDVVVSGTARATTATVGGSGPEYTVEVSGMRSGGTVRVGLAAGAAQDGVGNPSAGSTSTDDTVTFQGDTAPTIAVAPGGRCGQLPRRGLMRFRVADADHDRLTVRARTSNRRVVPADGITVDGTKVTIAPLAAERTRRATVTLTVSDGRLSASTEIHVTVGSPGADTLIGTSAADLMFGRSGADVLAGRGGIDLLCGGRGDDRVEGGPGDDAVYGGDGNDVVRGGAGNDVLHGGRGADRLTGNAGADLFIGGYGHDVYTDVNPSEGDATRG